ncbi:MAG: hypothetical protein ABII22_04725 [Candidatus Micrarchaeota archaeon]
MKDIDKLTKEWFVLRKEQEAVLKKLGWWQLVLKTLHSSIG